MKIESPAFAAEGDIPSIHTCDGRNVSPELRISDVPEGAVSLALIMHDPDSKKDWIHWTLWNIDPSTTVLAEGTAPGGTGEGLTDFGTVGYGGPCPVVGRHRYVFELSALDLKLTLDPATDAATLRQAMEGHMLASASFMGTYARH